MYNKNKKKIMTSKNLKTILFGALLAAMILPFSSFEIANADTPTSKNEIVDQKVEEFKELKQQKRALKEQLKNLDSSDTVTKKQLKSEIKDLKKQIKSLKDEVKQKIKVEKNKSKKLDKAFNKVGKTFLDESSKNFRDSNIVDVFVDPIGEQLVVMTSGEITKKHQKLIEKKLAKNVDVLFVEGDDLACSNRSDCTPVRGGVTITSTSGLNTRTSTLGFFATQEDGDFGFVTTNHSTYNDKDVKHNGSVIGIKTDGVNSWSCDCAFIELAPNTSTWANSVYKTSSTVYSIVGYESSSNTSVGDFAVMSGHTSGVESGIIIAFGWWGMVYTTLDATYGDSGAPVLEADDKIVGIIKGQNFIVNPHGTWVYYSAYEDIKSELNLN